MESKTKNSQECHVSQGELATTVLDIIRNLDEEGFGILLACLTHAFTNPTAMRVPGMENILRFSSTVQHMAELWRPFNGETAEHILLSKMLESHGVQTRGRTIADLRRMFESLLCELEDRRQSHTPPGA